MRFYFAGILLLLPSTSFVSAQSKADLDVLRQAHSLYSSPHSEPAYLACHSSLDWDAVAKQTRMPETDDYRHGLALVKAMTIAFVTRGADDTTVTVVGDERVGRQKEEMRAQIEGFFAEYWKLVDGRLFPSPKSPYPYEVASGPEGYVVTIHLPNEATGTIVMDTSFLVTKISAKRAPSELEVLPTFHREADGLLHLRGMRMERTLGESKEVWEYSLDYQQVGGFYVPLHMTTSRPGAFSSTHTFSDCQALDKANAPPAPRESKP